jgi:hypothetical protein
VLVVEVAVEILPEEPHLVVAAQVEHHRLMALVELLTRVVAVEVELGFRLQELAVLAAQASLLLRFLTSSRLLSQAVLLRHSRLR